MKSLSELEKCCSCKEERREASEIRSCIGFKQDVIRTERDGKGMELIHSGKLF